MKDVCAHSAGVSSNVSVRTTSNLSRDKRAKIIGTGNDFFTREVLGILHILKGGTSTRNDFFKGRY
jgi:hypothetical protein